MTTNLETIPARFIKICRQCGQQFYRRAPPQKFCCPNCREEYRRRAEEAGRELLDKEPVPKTASVSDAN